MNKNRNRAPGPTEVPERVLQAMARQVIHHRTPKFEAIFSEVRQGTKRLLGTVAELIFLSCSGTGAMEAAVVNLLSPGDRVVVIQAGEFGKRWAEMLLAFGMDVLLLPAPYGETVQPDVLRAALIEHRAINAVFCQHSETSTGVLHPIQAYAGITRQTDALLVVDAVSSVGCAELAMDDWGIDVVVAGGQKGLMVPPGLGIVALSERAWKAATVATLPRYYFDLFKELALQRTNQVRFTPAVSLIVGLNEALDMLWSEGWPGKVLQRHERLARATRSAVTALGLELFAKSNPSPAITSVVAPNAMGEAIVAGFAKYGMTIAGGQGPMKGNVFRLGHMGYTDEHDVIVMLGILERVLSDVGHHFQPGVAVAAAQRVFAEVRE